MVEGSQTFEDDIARMIRNDIVDQKEGLAHSDSPTNLMWKLGNTAPGQTPVLDPVKQAAAEAEVAEAAIFSEIILEME